MSGEHFELTPTAGSYRLRLSADILGHLEWPKDPPQFDCFGIFRAPGELLCAAEPIREPGGAHVFDSVLNFSQDDETVPIGSLADVPPARLITARYRIITFPAVWVGEKHLQLDLKLGSECTRRLGWTDAATPSIHAWAWSRLLLLLSDQRFNEVQREDIGLGLTKT